MAYYTYWASALTGGGTGAVDKIPTADLSDKCGVIAILLTGTYVYHVDDDSGAAESSPWVIAPDDVGAGNLRLILVDVVAPNLTGKLLKLYDTDFSHSLTVKWNEDDDTNRILNLLMAGGNRSFTLNENLTVGDGTDITLTGVTQANTLTLNESFTIGDGFDGTLTFKNASKALNVEDTNLTPRTGWPTAPGVTLSFSDGDRTFTVTDGGSAFYYILGVKYTLGGNKTVVIDNTEGLWYIYFDGATLTASQTIWSFTAEDKALVAYLNWDATADNEKSIFLGYELHTFHMDGSTHARLHYAGGARWETGLLVTDAGSEIVNVAAGDIWDEDLNLPITDGAGDALFEQVLSPAELPIYYLDGASNWRIYETTAGEKANATDVGYVSAANDLKYNKLNGTWANADVGLNNYVAYYVVATNEQTEPVALIMGQRVDNKLSDAKENNTFSGLTLTDLPFEEMVVLARLILKGTGSGVYYTLEEVLDLRVYNIKGNITSPLIPDHGGLAGLGDDDHVQYVLKSTWGAYSILAADTNDTPAAVTLAVSEMIGRKATGGIVALAKVDILTILNVADGADVTGSNAPQAHNLIDTTGHPVSGLTTGHFLKATGAAAYAFAAHGLTYSDVGAEQSGVSVLETDYNADTFMYATADNTPVATSPANVLAALSGYAGADFDFNGQYATQLQNIPDLASKGAGYWFDGVNDVIAVADNADLDPGTGDFSILVAFKAGSQGAVGLFDRHSGTNYIRLTLNADGTFTQLFRVYPGSPTSFVSGGTYNDNNNHIVCVTYDRDALAQLYGDGIPDGSVNIAANAASFDISTVLSIGSLTLSNFLKGQISRTLLFNLVLSATEVEAFSSGASVPYKYIGASQTGLSTSTLVNNVAHDYETFDGASATGFHAINATYYGIAQTVDEVVLKIGKRYRVSFSAAIVSGTPGVYVMSASVGNVAVSGSATQTIVSGLNVYEFTSGVSDTCVLYWQTNDGVAAEYTISNFAITQIGCVLQLEQSGITDATWYDSSGNDLDGTVSGAVAINLPDVDAHLASLGITATVAQINATCNP